MLKRISCHSMFCKFPSNEPIFHFFIFFNSCIFTLLLLSPTLVWTQIPLSHCKCSTFSSHFLWNIMNSILWDRLVIYDAWFKNCYGICAIFHSLMFGEHYKNLWLKKFYQISPQKLFLIQHRLWNRMKSFEIFLFLNNLHIK